MYFLKAFRAIYFAGRRYCGNFNLQNTSRIFDKLWLSHLLAHFVAQFRVLTLKKTMGPRVVQSFRYCVSQQSVHVCICNCLVLALPGMTHSIWRSKVIKKCLYLYAAKRTAFHLISLKDDIIIRFYEKDNE